ncbi:hypothetical protein KUCAC02_017646 [Chaenocephalus aceratus]|uniref:Uncharacterized protein n=1 Tax=Chaenocephalus aceratus TaxID=36190 RepID=A0ACB9W2F6_CHAAC|nr:hypothetical protein KUCAC02_017646 [Chaenocephalus aceratus]
MSVVLVNTQGCVLDARSLIDKGYLQCIRVRENNQKSHVNCRFKGQCFQILKSHLDAIASVAADGGNIETLQKTDKPTKKRKRKHSELNQGEIDSQAFHKKIRSVVLEGTKSLVDSARSLGYLNGTSTTDTVKEPLPSQECSLAALCEMAKELPLVDDEQQQEECAQPLVTADGSTSHVDLFSRVTENRTDWATVMEEGFDLIVMDPPWENKSVKRSRRYSCLPSSQLKRMPIPLLASPNGFSGHLGHKQAQPPAVCP